MDPRQADDVRFYGDKLLRLSRRVIWPKPHALYLTDDQVVLVAAGGEEIHPDMQRWAVEVAAEIDFGCGAPSIVVTVHPPDQGELVSGHPVPAIGEARIDDWADYRRIRTDEPLVLYHGTADRARLIAEGMEPAAVLSDPFHQPCGVYLTSSVETAEMYGDELVAVNATGLRLYDDPLEDHAWFTPDAVSPERVRPFNGEQMQDLLCAFGLDEPGISAGI